MSPSKTGKALYPLPIMVAHDEVLSKKKFRLAAKTEAAYKSKTQNAKCVYISHLTLVSPLGLEPRTH
jgi:hypothetical protein